MSWSANFIGKPEKVVEALQKQSETLSGQSKEEYDKALPHMVGLINQNSSKYNPGLMVQINASGHASFSNGECQESHCSCEVKQIWGILV